METKGLDLAHKAIASGVEVKDAEKGIVEAVVGRVNVKDHEDDIFLPGAFGDRDVRLSAYNHRSWPQRGGLPPVGRGTIKERGDEVVAELRFFMSTQDGREHFEQVKQMGDLQEWSFGWLPGTEVLSKVTDDLRDAGVRRAFKSVPVVEVSPVLMGASVGTRTTAVKCDACAAKAAELEEEEEIEPEANADDVTEEVEAKDAETEEPEAEPSTEEPEDEIRNQIMAEVGRYELLQANKPAGL